MREYFCAYHSMLGALRKLSDTEVGRLFRGLLYYSQTGEEPTNLQGREELLFDVFAQQIDRDAEAYENKCRHLKANGSKSKQMVANGSKCEQEKEEDKEKDNSIINANTRDDDDDARPDFNTVEAYTASNLMHMSPTNMQECASFVEDLGEDLVRYAVDKACEAGKRTWGYTKAILNAYLRDGIKSVGDAKAADEARRRKKQESSVPQSNTDMSFDALY